MRIVVTGAAGFIGSWLLPALQNEGHKVYACDYLEGDLRGGRTTAEILLQEADLLIHLAAIVGRERGEDHVTDTARVNAGATLALAQVCGERDIRMCYASSSEVYGDQGHNAVYESSALNPPHNAYALTKLWGEQACKLYVPAEMLTIWRLSMPYGPGLRPGQGRAAIVNMLWQARHGYDIPVHRDGVRSWCWIGDTIRAMMLTLLESGTFNIGRDDDARTMQAVAELACQLTGASTDLIREVAPPPRQTLVKNLRMDTLRELGWAPEVSLESGMLHTLVWLDEVVIGQGEAA